MEMQIHLVGAGISIPNTGLSVNALSYVYFFFRNADGVSSTVFGFDQTCTIGAEAQTLVVSDINTDWIFLDPTRNPWSLHKRQLVGKQINLQIDGMLAGSGRIDIRMDEISDEGFVTNLLTRDSIKASGFQMASSSIRGVMKWKPSGPPPARIMRMGKLPKLSGVSQ